MAGQIDDITELKKEMLEEEHAEKRRAKDKIQLRTRSQWS